MRYFFLSFQYDHYKGVAFANLTHVFDRHPTLQECKDFLRLKTPYAENIVLLGITEFSTKEDFETFKSEI